MYDKNKHDTITKYTCANKPCLPVLGSPTPITKGKFFDRLLSLFPRNVTSILKLIPNKMGYFLQEEYYTRYYNAVCVFFSSNTSHFGTKGQLFDCLAFIQLIVVVGRVSALGSNRFDILAIALALRQASRSLVSIAFIPYRLPLALSLYLL